MSASPIPDDVERFVRAHIHSIEQLEVLLQLRREATRSWSAEAISRELRIDRDSAANRLLDLERRGLLLHAGDGGFSYRVGNAEEQAVDALARTYADRRVSIITLIFSKPDPLQSFADAFRLKEPKR